MAIDSPRSRHWLTLLAAAFGALLLGGCAAAAIPVLAGGVLAKDRIDSDGQSNPEDRPERIPIDYNAPPGTPMPSASPAAMPTPSPGPQPVKGAVAATPSAERPSPVQKAPPTDPVPPARSARIAAASERPAPVAPSPLVPHSLARAASDGGTEPYGAFVDFALSLAPPPPPGTTRRSALVDQETIADNPRLSDCGDEPAAVLVDLDPGTASFDPADPPLPAPGLAAGLAQLRAAGITVLWTASVPVERAQEVWTVLRATGLDPDRTDRLVLPRRADERKQTRRLLAGRDWCIVAIAGDRRSDFDEVFDYLRDPDGPIAQALDPALGRGWFLVPTPIE
jgi:hypothetical protein